MCNQEIVALTAVLVLAVGTALSFASMASVSLWLAPRTPPAKSDLADWAWDHEASAERVTDELAMNFSTNGFTVLRGVIDPAVIDVLLNESKRLCSTQLWMSKVCQVEEGRWQSDVFRDFLLHGPVGSIVSKILGKPTLRLYQDGLLGVQHSRITPLFYTFTRHIDHGGSPGIYHGLHSDSVGASVWIPLNDIDEEETGGSITVYDKFPQSGCQHEWGERSTVAEFDSKLNATKISARCQKYKEGNSTVTPSVKRGDVVVWMPSMLHNTQPVKLRGFVRFALYARIVASESLLCVPKDCGWKGRPCCSGVMPPSGSKLETPCFPQVYPRPLDGEVESHFGPNPQPLIDRRKMQSKYTTDHTANMHKDCKDHFAGPPEWSRDLFKLKPEFKIEEKYQWRFATDFSCEKATYEGDCYIMNVTEANWERLTKTGSPGMPFFFSKDVDDAEKLYFVPWDGSVKAVDAGDKWVMAGDYFLLKDFFRAKLELRERPPAPAEAGGAPAAAAEEPPPAPAEAGEEKPRDEL